MKYRITNREQAESAIIEYHKEGMNVVDIAKRMSDMHGVICSAAAVELIVIKYDKFNQFVKAGIGS
jgi:hypothetical protein